MSFPFSNNIESKIFIHMPKFVIVDVDRMMCNIIRSEPVFRMMAVDEVFENMFNGRWENFKAISLFHYNHRKDREPDPIAEERDAHWDYLRDIILENIQARADVCFWDYQFKKWLTHYVAIFEVKDYAPTAHCINFKP